MSGGGDDLAIDRLTLKEAVDGGESSLASSEFTSSPFHKHFLERFATSAITWRRCWLLLEYAMITKLRESKIRSCDHEEDPLILPDLLQQSLL